MGLIDRLIGTEQPKLRVHPFMAALGELERGKMTQAQVITAFNLSPAEQTTLTSLIAKVIFPNESISLGGFVTLTNVGAAYDTTNAGLGLGSARVQCAGITGFEFTVGVNKIGTGTQSWQLWDQTNSVELAVIDDAGAVGNKTLSTVVTLGSPLPPSVRTIRVRAKSTVAADDPLYYGAGVMIRRVDVLVAEILHQVLLLAEMRFVPYETAAKVQTRLGL